MPTIADVLNALEEIAPTRYAFSFDKVGLQIGDAASEVEKAIVSFDRSLAAAAYAAEQRAQLLISHHPLIWEPLKSLLKTSHVGKTVIKLIQNDVAFIAAHTNWDAAPGGINDTFAQLLGLQNVTPFGEAAKSPRVKLVVFTPEDSAQPLIDAAAEAGAGVIGLYRRCAYLSPGIGTFHAPPGTNPAVGDVGGIEQVSEVRIEMVLPESLCGNVSAAITKVHPYEEPAYDFVRLTEGEEHPIGRIGTLPTPKRLVEFASQVNRDLETVCWTWGDPARMISKVAVCGGAADDEWLAAKAAGADILVTGEVKQHVAVEATESDFALIAAGHYATENPGSKELRNRLASAMPEIEWLFYDPRPGFSGRPL